METLIIDRTADDVSAVAEALSRIESGNGTAEDTALLLSNKGSYSAADLNRVGEAVLYVAEKMSAKGYPVNVRVKHDWKSTDIPTFYEMFLYLRNIEKIRKAIDFPMDIPDAPTWPLDWQKANDIERILLMVNDLVDSMTKVHFYSGDIFSGEA